jgi:hypothetical protein
MEFNFQADIDDTPDRHLPGYHDLCDHLHTHFYSISDFALHM